MLDLSTDEIGRIAEDYTRDGDVSPVRLFSEEDAAGHRARQEQTEAAFGSLHYRT